MAEFAEMGDATERYAAIEKAYRDQRWPVVIDQGGRLLSQLDPEDGGLRQRLQLLMAHSYLYGFGERDAAEDLYRAVMESKAEASLRQMAAEGLEQCDLPPLATGTPAPAAQSVEAAPGLPAQAHLKPEDLPQPVQAPALADDGAPSLHESVQALIPTLPEEAPPAHANAPVMPWLESAPPSSSVAAASATAAAAELPWPQTPQAGGGGAVRVDDQRIEAERVEAEVIDEPELIEVHQADPSLAEEIELQETRSQREGASAVGLAPTRQDEPGLPPTPGAPSNPPIAAVPAGPTAVVMPPVEVDPAEDAELRQGLLRVEIL